MFWCLHSFCYFSLFVFELFFFFIVFLGWKWHIWAGQSVQHSNCPITTTTKHKFLSEKKIDNILNTSAGQCNQMPHIIRDKTFWMEVFVFLLLFFSHFCRYFVVVVWLVGWCISSNISVVSADFFCRLSSSPL